MSGFLTNLLSKMSMLLKPQEGLESTRSSLINYRKKISPKNSTSSSNILSIDSYKKDSKGSSGSSTSTLSTSYISVTNPYQIEIIFKQFRDVLIDKLSTLTRSTHGSISYPAFFKDAGKSQGNKSYFYIQPYNQSGLLFEENQSGWTVSSARYNAEEKSYTKEKEILETVELYIPKTGIGNIRLNSQLFNLKLVTFKTYEEKMVTNLELYLKNGQNKVFLTTGIKKEELLG